MVYADHTGTGQIFKPVDDVLSSDVHPYHCNLHSQNPISLQTQHYVEEAKQIIKQYYNLTPDDALICQGAGSTGAVAHLLRILRESRMNLQPSGWMKDGENAT
ncbi:MAG: hypothetical protein KVP17_001317 [Porospora cf. gigantea B]|uniref:uncharacterized protein n=1 Tax=Porospora cf. gigantea B TaxID=2853592 RepID=UPI0035717F85|nr:MAG: hypothetical protein KVP17_001317 [Porospora cf. gigantea B]